MHREVAAVCLQVSESTISRYIAKFRTTGNVKTKPIGRPVGSIAIHPALNWSDKYNCFESLTQLILEQSDRSTMTNLNFKD